MPDQLTNVLTDLMNRLGTTAENFWPVYVEYTRIVHLTALLSNLAFTIIFVIITFICIYFMKWGYTQREHESITDTGMCVLIIGGFVGFVAAIASLVFLQSVFNELPGVLIPQAQAVIDILSKLNTTVKK